MRKYVVKQFVDTLDTKPRVSAPVEYWEAEELAIEWLEAAIDWTVQHSSYALWEAELEEIREHETTLIRIEEV